MTDRGRPEPGKLYRLTGTSSVPSIMKGNSWAESEIGPGRYCYQVQAWIEAGKVGTCGHQEPSPTCYACQHAGEAHECGSCS